MSRVVSFLDIENLHSVAEDFSRLLSRHDNSDISNDFPGTMRRYSGEANNVYDELVKTRTQCQLGIREQFIVFAGESAVGLSAIQITDNVPGNIEKGVPNLSGLIANPWRSHGLGSISLRHRLDIIDNRFHGSAYSIVRKNNHISQKLVESCGLIVVGETEFHLTYLYKSIAK